MIKTGGRNDVFVQWFSRDFMEANKELFDKIVIMPGEALFMIKDGKIGDVVTETTKHVLPGFLGKVKEFVVGKKDIQLLYVDMKPRAIQIPLEGYTQDRTDIKGVANMMFKVSRENIYRVINMFPRGLKSDTKWDDNSIIKEVCEEDVAGFFAYDSKVTVDSYVFSKWKSTDIRDNLAKFVDDIMSCMNDMMPHWARYGLDVTVNTIDMTDNAYEDVQKFRSIMSQKQAIEDIKAANAIAGMGNVASMERERVRLEKSVEMEKVVANIELQNEEFHANLRRELEQSANDVEKIEIELKGELAKAKTNDEIRRINGVTDLDIRKAQEEQDLYMEKERNEIMQSNADRDLERILTLRNNSLQLDYNEKISQMKAEFVKQVSEAEAKVERAYDEGFRQGCKEEGNRQYELGYAKGLAAGAEKQVDSVGNAVANTAAAFRQPQYAPYPGYGQMPYAPQYQQPAQYQQPPAQQAEEPSGGEFRFCSECGAKCPAGVKFCSRCGNKL